MTELMVFVAFVFGFLVTRVGLPPLIGYLLAGFLLSSQGIEGGDRIEELADVGILLLLFSIGLKLKIRNLLRVEIWGSASLHMTMVVAGFTLILVLFTALSLPGFTALSFNQALLLAFGLSFSSTVFAVKTFEERGDDKAVHSVVAIGILIIQDIAAVIFLTISLGSYPSPWALALIPALFLLRPTLSWLLSHSGHRELLLLFGLFVAIGVGAGGFELVGLKPDLGALILGIMLAQNAKAQEVADSILSIKDLLLVGFFLNIGLTGTPDLLCVAVALLLVGLMSIKTVLFYLILTRLKLRARTAQLASMALSNYSEFGLLVCTVAYKNGWLEARWLTTMAVAVALSFLVSSSLNRKALSLYNRYSGILKRFETKERLPQDQPIDTGDANVLIFGMGRIGTRVYDVLKENGSLEIVGIDLDSDTVAGHCQEGRRVIKDDATDFDLWEKICTRKVELAMLTMTSHQANMFALQQLQEAGFTGQITAVARFADEQQALREAGASLVYDFYDKAGQGYADDIIKNLVDSDEAKQAAVADPVS